MRLFVSWSGSVSRQVGEMLRARLPCVIQGLEVFMSQHDIESGARWTVQLAQQLEDCNFGILCLTPRNLSSPWLLFEAGALAKLTEGRACGLLLQGLSPADVTGPLSQFQNRPFVKDEFRKLLMDVNNRFSGPLQPDQLATVFEKWWPDIEADYRSALESPAAEPPAGPIRGDRDLLSEILTRLRDMEREVQEFPILLRRTDPSVDRSLTATPGEIFDMLRQLDSETGAALRRIVTAHKSGGNYEMQMAVRDISATAFRDLLGRGLLLAGPDGYYVNPTALALVEDGLH